MTTFSAFTPQTETTVPADSARLAARKAQQAALRKRLQAEEAESAGMSHSDSVFLFPSANTFEAICAPESDLQAVVSPSAYQSSYLRLAAKADSVASAQAQVTTEVAIPATLEPTPRGHAPLSPYAGGAAISFLAVVLILGLVRIASRNFLGDLFGFFSGGIGWKRLESSQFVQLNLSFTLVDAIYAVMLAVLTVEAVLLFSPGTVEEFGAYRAAGIVALAIAAYYLGRRVTDTVISYAFRLESHMRTMAIYRKAACGIIGLLLAPCALLMPFVSRDGCMVLIGAASFVIIAITLLCLGKVLRINMTSLPTIFYFILYLCIVVAAPLVCLARVASLVLLPDATLINQ